MAHACIHALDGEQSFDVAHFLACAGVGTRIVHCDPNGVLFSQGDSADSVFYVQSGRLKVTVVSANGKEATITLLSAGDFIGEDSLTGTAGHRSTSVTAITPSYTMKITRSEMIRVMHDEHKFSDLFLSHLLARSMRTQADLVDQLFNSSEKRLARLLLLMAEYGEPGKPTKFIPPITQETLAEMVGTTRSRVSFFSMQSCTIFFLSTTLSRSASPLSRESLLTAALPSFVHREDQAVPTCLPAPLQQQLATMKDQWVPDGTCVVSGMSLRGRMNQSRLFVPCKGQENERRTHIREWIASLANGDTGRPRLWAVSSLCD